MAPLWAKGPSITVGKRLPGSRQRIGLDPHCRGPRELRGENDGSGSEEDDDDDEEESEEEEEEESEEEGEGKGNDEPELTRAERKELKKKQAAQKQAEQEEDPDLINPNHVEKKLNISDLGAAREPTRRER